MSDTCSLFSPFGDPWPSCLLSQTRSVKYKTEGLWGQGPKKSGKYSRGDCLRVKEFRAGILRAALLDVEGLREKMEFAPAFC